MRLIVNKANLQVYLNFPFLMQIFIDIRRCLKLLLCVADAYWSPYWFGAGWCGGREDASLLPFWEQCHFSQQV